MINDVSVETFLNNEYKKYAIYTIENRAIPSVIDGMKPTHRKIFFTALGNVRTVPNKVSTLAGKVISEAMYHNGNVSCEDAMIGMTQDFKNNIPYFKGIGQFGSLKNPFASSSRYISVLLDEKILNVFKDDFLLERNVEDSVLVEPKYYLPIIPMVLINGSSGIALGYSTKILNRDPKDILKKCISILKSKNYNSELKPKITGFCGKIERDSENPKKWYFTGTYEMLNATTIKITEIPPGMTFEKFENLLEELIDLKTIITYDNKSSDKIEYHVKFSRENIQSLNDEKIMKLFKLQESHTENFNTLDEYGKLKIFESADDILKYFVEFRLNYYHKRKEFLIRKLDNELKTLSNKGRFIKAILDGKLEIKNVKKDILISKMEELGLEKNDDSYDYLLRLPIWSLTNELYEKLKQDFKLKKEEVAQIKLTEPKDMYLSDLTELDKKI